MNVKLDRRQIAGLLKEHFPHMPDDASSDDWHGFLNEKTGLNIDLETPNAVAFDRWRQALAEKFGLPVWMNNERLDAIKKRTAELLAMEKERREKIPETLNELRKETSVNKT
jgi:hypothetical protein